MTFLRQFLSDKRVEKKYVNSGAQFGDAVSYLYMGECQGFESLLNKWASWEQEYSNRGYRTVSLDDFVNFGGYGKSIYHLLGRRLEENEEPIFHAQIYLNSNYHYFSEKSILNPREITGISKTYKLPSTK